ncbi:CefM protein [Emericellopsis cladophorae]|uniref:CefM protein n=1 Tax=Emericellopsis cladophorae TaxID=2686198 RepID=A0A9P9Y1E0_9HYPO|nr:CefM protein [Emericellopsis cladophorae]KAI6781570.1 CefM protein [Emericellopsis cladophorae]
MIVSHSRTSRAVGGVLLNAGATYHNRNYPEHPSPALQLGYGASKHRSNRWTHQRSKSPRSHGSAALFLNKEVAHRRTPDCQYCRRLHSRQQPEDNQGPEVRARRAAHGEQGEQNICDMVRDETAMEFGHGCNKKWSKGQSNVIHAYNQRAEYFTVLIEFKHSLAHSWRSN